MGAGGIIAGILGLGVVLAVAQKFLGVNPLSALGQGIGQFGAGVQTAISDIFSPQITPSFVPTLGLNFKLGLGLTSTNQVSSDTGNAPKGKQQGFSLSRFKIQAAQDFGQMLIDARGIAARETGAWDASG